MIKKPDIKWGFLTVIVAVYILADLVGAGLVPWYVSVLCCMVIGLAASWVVDHYWNSLTLNLLLSAKDHGIRITTTANICPHCGENLRDDPEELP